MVWGALNDVVHFEAKMLMVAVTNEILVCVHDYNSYEKAIALNNWHAKVDWPTVVNHRWPILEAHFQNVQAQMCLQAR